MTAGVGVGGRFKTGQLGSNQNQPLFLFRTIGDILARSDFPFFGVKDQQITGIKEVGYTASTVAVIFGWLEPVTAPGDRDDLGVVK